MIDRRGFLGTAIGLMASGKYFIAEKAETPKELIPSERYRKLLEVFILNDKDLSKFNCQIKTDNHYIKGTPFKNLTKTETSFNFQFEDIIIKKSCTIQEFILINHEGIKISTKKYGNIYVVNNDIFKFDFTFNFNIVDYNENNLPKI